jgi:hypothetical protein
MLKITPYLRNRLEDFFVEFLEDVKFTILMGNAGEYLI